ncbi:MAG: hypothetical protein ACYTBX_19700, partial [Planctomycetota bacterium]
KGEKARKTNLLITSSLKRKVIQWEIALTNRTFSTVSLVTEWQSQPTKPLVYRFLSIGLEPSDGIELQWSAKL